MIDMTEAIAEADKQIAADKLLVQSLLDNGDILDEDGYPTEDALTIVEKWSFDDAKGWFDFIHSIWHLKSWGWPEGIEPHEWNKDETVYRYQISTAGWSGNESLIAAMRQNYMNWSLTWVQSRRGGHYIFELGE